MLQRSALLQFVLTIGYSGVAVPPMLDSISFGTYIFFACWCFLAATFSYFLVPETSRLTLEQVDELFESKIPGWRRP